MSTKLFHSIYSYASKLGCDRPRKNLLEEIKSKIRKIDIFSAININIKVVTTTNLKIALQQSLQNLLLDFSTKKISNRSRIQLRKWFWTSFFYFTPLCDPLIDMGIQLFKEQFKFYLKLYKFLNKQNGWIYTSVFS